MSSSIVLSPQPNATSIIAEGSAGGSRPQRSTRNAINYSERGPEHSSVSPKSITPARSTAKSTRSRRSISSSVSFSERSPDKRSVSSQKKRGRSPMQDANDLEAALGLVLGDEASTDDNLTVEPETIAQDAGEEEVLEVIEVKRETAVNGGDREDEDDDSSASEEEIIDLPSRSEISPVKWQSRTRYPSPGPNNGVGSTPHFLKLNTSGGIDPRTTRQRTISPEKKAVLDDPNKKSVIRLLIGTKRKAVDESDHTDREETPAEVLPPPVVSSSTSELKSDNVLDEYKGDARKRLPRKKRKWLKKGQVDPDDPVAVARQRERHKLIDEAIEDLNRQEEALLLDSHPQLLWLWEELERRREAQLQWLEARHEATIGDLARLRDHEQSVAKSQFHIEREELAGSMVRENRHRMARVKAERIALRRGPQSMALVRIGRGGGGWSVAKTALFSNGKQELLPMTTGEDPSMRRDVSRKPKLLNHFEAKADLEKIGIAKPRRHHHSATPPLNASRSSLSERQPPSHSTSQQQSTKPQKEEHMVPSSTAYTRSYAPGVIKRPELWDFPLISHNSQTKATTPAPRPRSPERINRTLDRPINPGGDGQPRHRPVSAFDYGPNRRRDVDKSTVDTLPRPSWAPNPSGPYGQAKDSHSTSQRLGSTA